MNKELLEQEKWEEKFDKDYPYAIEWVVGIVAAALAHARTKKVGEDASYITNKLKRLVAKEKNTSYLQGRTDERSEVIKLIKEMFSRPYMVARSEESQKAAEEISRYVGFAIHDLLEALKK